MNAFELRKLIMLRHIWPSLSTNAQQQVARAALLLTIQLFQPSK
jgi:hypothetical protein